MDCSLPDSSVHRDSLGKNTGVGCHALLQRLFPTHGLNPGLPDCEWILYCLESSGKPENTGAGSLSLLQGILPTQESNQGLPHCRWILYQLSYQGSPIYYYQCFIFYTVNLSHALKKSPTLKKVTKRKAHFFKLQKSHKSFLCIFVNIFDEQKCVNKQAINVYQQKIIFLILQLNTF